MIDHIVSVGGVDVSEDVIKISVRDQIESDSDPGKFTIVLANPSQKYTMAWPPQKTPVTATVKNWVYDDDEDRALAGGHAEVEYLVFTGHMTDLSANADEATIIGECDLGHLADAIPHEYDRYNVRASEVLKEVLSWHTDEPITLHWQVLAEKDLFYERKTYADDWTYQDIIEDIRDDTGSIYYFSRRGVLEFKDPAAIDGTYDLDPYVTNPNETASIMGFRNVVTVVGDKSLRTPGKDYLALETSAPDPIQYTARDEESIAEVGELVAPSEMSIHLKTYEQVKARAEQLLEFYKMHKNALTKVNVTGIIPPLHSRVSYTPFAPIAGDEVGPVQAVVVAREVEYSINGIDCTLTLSPGMMDYDMYVGDAEIEEFTETFGDEDE